jgi:hypothetical protein
MKTYLTTLAGQVKTVRITIAALLTAGAVGGWTVSTMLAKAAVVEESRLETIRAQTVPAGDVKPHLVGSYKVTGTDPDGLPYSRTSIVDVALAPSGALELEWDYGRQVGVGQVIGNTLAVACVSKGRTSILVMTINPDGSLSGVWSRRTDRGTKATETWKKT